MAQVKAPTQIDRMLVRMQSAYPNYVCATEFNEMGIFRYGARFYDMRQDGIKVEQEPCDNAWHRHGPNFSKYRFRGSKGKAPGEELFEAFQ